MTTMRFKVGRENFCEVKFDREPTYNELSRLGDYIDIALRATPDEPRAKPPPLATVAAASAAKSEPTP